MEPEEMILVPAIDILGGKVVRLKKGDYDQVTVYSDDPVEQAKKFEAAGAERIHIVDLDGARDGAPTNINLISRIACATEMTVEVGGGIRNLETFERYLDCGATRLVLGSALVRDPDFAREAARLYSDCVVAGIDAKGGMVAIEGWRQGTSTPAAELVGELKDMGIHELVYTDIARDGMQCGIDAAAYGAIAKAAGFPITASGGISSLDDLRALGSVESPGIDGVIAGRALYEGSFSVEEGVELCRALTEGRA
jgi:phosphoribosylformimino-5-aminoimidazole carboxamide ribotide isomerase